MIGVVETTCKCVGTASYINDTSERRGERMVRARQTQGIATAKANNVKFGRPKTEKPDNWNEVIRQWQCKEITAKKAIELLELKKSTFYALLKTETEGGGG